MQTQVHLLFEDGDQAHQVWDHVILPDPPTKADKGKGVWACVDRYSYQGGNGFRRFMHGKIVDIFDGTQPAAPAPKAEVKPKSAVPEVGVERGVVGKKGGVAWC